MCVVVAVRSLCDLLLLWLCVLELLHVLHECLNGNGILHLSNLPLADRNWRCCGFGCFLRTCPRIMTESFTHAADVALSTFPGLLCRRRCNGHAAVVLCTRACVVSRLSAVLAHARAARTPALVAPALRRPLHGPHTALGAVTGRGG